MPVCVPRSLPGFVDTVTVVADRGSPAEVIGANLRPDLRDPLPRQLSASNREFWR
jgi:hypothetical protein